MFHSDDILVLQVKYECIPSQRYIYSFHPYVEWGGSRLKNFVEPRSGQKNFFSLSTGVWGHAPPENVEN